MRKIISAALFAMAVSVPAFAMDNDQETRMEQAKKEMRAMEDKHMQDRRAVEDECHILTLESEQMNYLMQDRRAVEDECYSKMKAMHERHQKEREEFNAKHGIGKDGKEGKEGRGNMEEKGGY